MPRRNLTPVADARSVAHEVLVRVDTTQAFADVLLADRLAHSRLRPVDQALATTLVYGTLAWQGRLDHDLAGLVRTPLARLDPPVRAALRLGLYQLRFLDRVPAYAAVDASVRLARSAGRGASGLVNAVLRKAAGDTAGVPLPDDPLDRLAVEWSHPRWLVERWAATFPPEELARLLAADNAAAPTVVRARPGEAATLRAELDGAGIATTPAAFAPDALVVDRAAARLRALPAYREGRVAFQGEASQLVTALLAPARGARVLDACAAPGGKSAHAAALVGADGVVVALDPRAAGARRIRTEAVRLRAGAVRVLVADARRPPLASTFDAVLVDAPCSGLGTLRRHPELRWRRRPEDGARLAVLQRDILTGVAPLVRPGGVLVYAVCTLAREENEDVVRALIAAEPRFVLERAEAFVPAAVVDDAGFLRTLPHRHGLDGFFAARLRASS